eukprot:12354562-Alexandrium_andersonii.AAC.1
MADPGPCLAVSSYPHAWIHVARNGSARGLSVTMMLPHRSCPFDCICLHPVLEGPRHAAMSTL